MNEIIGRKEEQELLDKLRQEESPVFLAIYGRRRVGKTYLVKSFFQEEFAFYCTGLFGGSTSRQLANFNGALASYSTLKEDLPLINDWFEAFRALIAVLAGRGEGRKVIFLDELSWMDTPKSEFIAALDFFWNSWASTRSDIFLIVCGSAASWMLNKLIMNKGGLYNRVTHRMQLTPFTLRETEAFLSAKKAVFTKYQLLQFYMIMGGIPFYLNDIDVEKSAIQNINNMAFGKNGKLRTDFYGVYSSLFKNEEQHISIVKALAKKSMGLTREEIATATKFSSGGTLTKVLVELEQSSFIRKYVAFGKKKYGVLYQLIDFYSLFYLKFIEGTSIDDTNTWINGIDDPSHRAWSGYAFELIGLTHIADIKRALKVDAIKTNTSCWVGEDNGRKAQIDLVIDRRDQVINLCEFKFSMNLYVMDKEVASNLSNKLSVFQGNTKTRKALFLTMITPNGLKENEHSRSVVHNQLTMDIFFGKEV